MDKSRHLRAWELTEKGRELIGSMLLENPCEQRTGDYALWMTAAIAGYLSDPPTSTQPAYLEGYQWGLAKAKDILPSTQYMQLTEKIANQSSETRPQEEMIQSAANFVCDT